MCGLSSFELFTIADQVGAVDSIYNESQCKVLQETVEELREDHLLEDIFGVNSRMENADWLDVVSKKANWVLSTTALRKKLFELASLVESHHNGTAA